MAWYSELSAAVRHWSDSESLSSNHVVADMFDSASGIVAAIGSKLLLFNQVWPRILRVLGKVEEQWSGKILECSLVLSI